MTDEQVKNGFNEVWLQFWTKYKDNIPAKDNEEEWDNIRESASAMKIKYPFMDEVITEMEAEFNERARVFEYADEERFKRFEQVFEVMEAIGNAEKSGKHEATCPCGGVIKFGRANINNHLHARCEKCGYVIMQ